MTRSWNSESIRQLPTLKSFITKFVLMVIFEEPLFYYAHRMLHHRSIYKYFHKKHHEWTAPVTAMTFYCHPVEHVVNNIGPVALLIVLLNAHIILGWLFGLLAVIKAMTDHTGYYFLNLGKGSVLLHDLHHAK
ncbi:hypothetical protein DOY81_005092 [Sarcophaga bullata]|nr:hypothetical protein DOY81_005092 [Sarcophaga bullata]